MALVMALAMFALEHVTPGGILTGYFYDTLHRLPLGIHREAMVVLVPVEAAERPSLDPILEKLATGHPRAILVTGKAEDVPTVSQFAARHPDMPCFMGIPHVPTVIAPDVYEPAPSCVVPTNGLPWGAVVLSPPDHGVTRRQYWRVFTEKSPVPTTEALLAQHLNGTNAHTADFLVDYRAIKDRIPNIQAGRLLRGEAGSTLVAGKVALVVSTDSTPMVTPLDGARGITSSHEFAAAALDTALRDRGAVATLAWPLHFLLLAFFGGASYWFLRRKDLDKALLWLLGGILLQTSLGWLLLVFPGLVWPAIPLAAIQFVGGLAAQIERSLDHRQILGALVLDTGEHQKILPEPTREADLETYWNYIVSFVDQFMHIDRAVFLERQDESNRVEAVWAFQCTTADIAEKRRDFQREPYLSALKAGGPIQLTSRKCLNQRQDEIQYLLPFVAFGNVQGFAVLGIHKDALPVSIAFDRVLKLFSVQVAEMLQIRHSCLAETSSDAKMEYFTSLGTDNALRIIQQQAGELDRNYCLLEALFKRISTPTLLIDLFGRVVQCNPRMVSLLNRYGINQHKSHALDILKTLTGIPEEDLRAALRRMILHREGRVFRSAAIQGTLLRIIVKPLELTNDAAEATSENTRPFGIEGLVLEVVEQTDDRDPLHQKVHQLKHLADDFQKEIEDAAIDTSSTPDAGLRMINAWVNQMESEILRGAPVGRAIKAIRPLPSLEQAIHDVNALLTLRRVAVVTSGDPGDTYIAASFHDLAHVFSATIQHLAEDAKKDTTIQAVWSRTSSSLMLTLTNEGHGLPSDTFHDFMEKHTTLDLNSLRGLAAAKRLVEEWGGRLAATSEFGKGTQVNLAFRLTSSME